jgi:hypothetical protein
MEGLTRDEVRAKYLKACETYRNLSKDLKAVPTTDAAKLEELHAAIVEAAATKVMYAEMLSRK